MSNITSPEGAAMRSVLNILGNAQEESDNEQVPRQEPNYDEVLLAFAENCIFLESLSHHWHLQTNVYDAHKVLEKLYTELPEFVDTFIEGILSTRGPLPCTGTAFVFQPVQEVQKVLTLFRTMCDSVHNILETLEDHSSVNALEDIMSFIDGILYQLRVLQ